MTNTPSPEPCPESIIQDLHRIRESIVESFGGDLHALTNDAKQRQSQSGRAIWRGKTPPQANNENGANSLESESTPAAG